MAWEVLWLIRTAVTQRCHPTAERAFGDGTRPDTSISPQLACNLATEDTARQRDAGGDTQVTKTMLGLSKRESWDFSPGGISLFLYRSQEHSTVRFKDSARGLRYFTLSLRSDSQGTGRASQHNPAVPGSPWQSFNYSPGKPCPAVPEERGQLAALPSLSPVLTVPATRHCCGGLGGHPTTSPVSARWVSHPWVHPWLDPELLAAGWWSLEKGGRRIQRGRIGSR